MSAVVEGMDVSSMVIAPEQPGIWEEQTNDGIFVKQMHIAKAGTFIPQHSHDYDHSSLLAFGTVRLWKDGVAAGDFAAPMILRIKAGVKHLFMAMEDDTVIYCIHNISRTGKYEWAEEYSLL